MNTKFWNRVKITDQELCWEWQGPLYLPDGYGHCNFMKDKKRFCQSHRFAYADMIGPIPDGLLVCHKCDNPKCCNPFHLFLGTNAQNIQDAYDKGLIKPLKGIKHGMHKLSEADVLLIRKLVANGAVQRSLAPRFGVTVGMISMIVNRKNWTHI